MATPRLKNAFAPDPETGLRFLMPPPSPEALAFRLECYADWLARLKKGEPVPGHDGPTLELSPKKQAEIVALVQRQRIEGYRALAQRGRGQSTETAWTFDKFDC